MGVPFEAPEMYRVWPGVERELHGKIVVGEDPYVGPSERAQRLQDEAFEQYEGDLRQAFRPWMDVRKAFDID